MRYTHFLDFPFNKFQTIAGTDKPILSFEVEGSCPITVPSRHDFYGFHLVEKGRGLHRIDVREYPIDQYQLHVLLPDQIHHWDIQDSLVHQVFIEKKIFYSVRESFHLISSICQEQSVWNLDESDFYSLKREFLRLRYEQFRDHQFKSILTARLRVISLLIARVISPDLDATGSEMKVMSTTINQFFLALETHFKEEKTVAFYASTLHVTPNYLNTICRNFSLPNPLQLIHRKVISEAKRYLCASDRTTSNIAYELGFSSLSNFSKFFKRETGLSPFDFRREYGIYEL